MDIFDEVDMESSHLDQHSLLQVPPSHNQDATRQPKAIRCKVDEVPLGADSGETRNSSDCFFSRSASYR